MTAEAILLKREELTARLLRSLSPQLVNDALARFVVDKFTSITAPEGSVSIGLVLLNPGGLGGATSRKPGNIILNWRRLFLALTD